MDRCAICKKEFESEPALHRHLKSHDILIKDYYLKYFPRHDLFDNSVIVFKTKDQYLTSSFNSVSNMKRWIKEEDKNIVMDFCKNELIKRKNKKNLYWTPTQVELLSSNLPPIQVYHRLFSDYYFLAKELGFRNKHEKASELAINWDKEYSIFIDTREQRPLVFDCLTKKKSLKFGDYSCSNNSVCCNIERKSLGDLVGSMSKGFERFMKEVNRSIESRKDLIVVVEKSLPKALDFSNSGDIFGKVSPEFIFHRIKALCQTFPSIQFLFVEDRNKSSDVIRKIFESNNSYGGVDLQYLYDIGSL